MRTLYHHPLCPFSRLVRVVMAEKKLEFNAEIERYWERRDAFVLLNPASEVPVLVVDDDVSLSDGMAIAEYLNEVFADPPLLPSAPLDRAEVRRLVNWFSVKFFREVTDHLLGEKVHKRLMGPSSEPDSRRIRAGFSALHQHLEYLGWLAERRTWLAGPSFSMADIAAAAQLSCLDYLNDVPWDNHPTAKEWYVKVKCRPSFRTLLADHLPGMPPARHYSDLDF